MSPAPLHKTLVRMLTHWWNDLCCLRLVLYNTVVSIPNHCLNFFPPPAVQQYNELSKSLLKKHMWLADSCAWQDNDPYSKSLSNKNDPLWRIPYNNQHFQLSNFLRPFSLITTEWLTFHKSFWEERALCGVPEHRGSKQQVVWVLVRHFPQSVDEFLR